MTFNLTVISRHERSWSDIDRLTVEVKKTVEQRVYVAPAGTLAVPPGNRYAVFETTFRYRDGRLVECNVDLNLVRFSPDEVGAILKAIQPRILAHRKQYRGIMRSLRARVVDTWGWSKGADIGILPAPDVEEILCDGVKFAPGMIGSKTPTPEIEAAIRADAAARFGIVAEALTGRTLDPAVVAQQVPVTPWVKDSNIGPCDPDCVEPVDADADAAQ